MYHAFNLKDDFRIAIENRSVVPTFSFSFSSVLRVFSSSVQSEMSESWKKRVSVAALGFLVHYTVGGVQ